MGQKVTPDNIDNVENNSGVPTINENFDKLANEFDKVHYRDGSQAATGDWDMNSRRILNLPPPVSGPEPLRLMDIPAGLKGEPGRDAEPPHTIVITSVDGQLEYDLPEDFDYDNNLIVFAGTDHLVKGVDYTAAGTGQPLVLAGNLGGGVILTLTTYQSEENTVGTGGEGLPVFVHMYRRAGDIDDREAVIRAGDVAEETNGTVVFAPGLGCIGNTPNNPVGEDPGSGYILPRWVKGTYKFGQASQNENLADPGNARNCKYHIPKDTYVVHAVQTSYLLYRCPVGVSTTPGSPIIRDIDDPEIFDRFEVQLDGTIDGNVDVEGFEENIVDIMACGVNGAKIHGTGGFYATRGDCIGVAPTDIGAFEDRPGQARAINHNANVLIKGLTFDGLNKNNRNAISLFDCDGLVIEDCIFKNFSRPGNGGLSFDKMDPNQGHEAPGHIDLEPNAPWLPWVVLRNIRIRGCQFFNGGTGGVTLNLPPNDHIGSDGLRYDNEKNIDNIVIEDCVFYDVPRPLLYNGGEHIAGPGNDVVWRNNRAYRFKRAFELTAGRGVTIENSIFEEGELAAYWGYVKGLRDITVKGNTFREIGNSIGVWEMIGLGTERYLIEDNTFIDCGGRAFVYGSGDYKNGTIKGNKAYNTPEGTRSMGAAIGLAFGSTAEIEEFSHKELNNDWGGLVHDGFVVDGSTFPRVPSGTWKRGNHLVNPKAPPGEPMALYCNYDISGSADPSYWSEQLKPGGKADPATSIGTLTKTAGMTQNGGRLTNTAGGVQSAYSTNTQGDFELIFHAGRSGSSGIYVGVSTAAAPNNITQQLYSVWGNSGQGSGTAGGSPFPFDTPYPYEWMIKYRVRRSGFTVTVDAYDPITDAPTTVASLVVGDTAARLSVILSNKGESVFIEKFGAI